MLLKEMFSPIGGPKNDDADIDWIGDLKFFIDSNDDLLQQYIFPAVKKHAAHVGHPKAYSLYLQPIMKCREKYVEEYDIKDPESKLPKDLIVELAKKIAEEQETHIKRKDYENKRHN